MSQTVPPTPSPTFFGTLLSRASEPSTWAAISAGAVATASQLPGPWQGYAVAVAMASAVIGVVLGEKGKAPGVLIQDSLVAVRNVQAETAPKTTTQGTTI